MIRRVITDRDVLTGGVGSPIVLDEHTLLTPAARDRAVQKGLVIVERGAAGPTAAAPGRACGCAGPASSETACGGCGGDCANCECASRREPEGSGQAGSCGARPETARGASPGVPVLGTLPDGLHLVRVEGGRIVSTLPAAGTGLMQPARGGTTP